MNIGEKSQGATAVVQLNNDSRLDYVVSVMLPFGDRTNRTY